MAKSDPVAKTEHKDVHAALLAAQASIGAAAKDSSNKFHGYKYTSADSMLAHCRDALADAGVFVAQTSVSRIEGSEWLRIGYVAVHSASSTKHEWSMDIPYVPEKGRPADKAACGAMTVSLSYAIRGLLIVPREDENEPDRRDDRSHVPASRPSAPPPQSRPTQPPPAREKVGAFTPYTDKRKPSQPIQYVTGTIDAIAEKEVSGGKTKVGVKINDEWYTAFADGARDAIKAIGKGGSVDLGFYTTQWGRDIYSIDLPTAGRDSTPALRDDEPLPF